MAKMTKATRERLERIEQKLARGIAFIDNPRTILATHTKHSNGLSFRRTVTAGIVENCMRRDDPLAIEGEQFCNPIDKHIGSEFTLARAALRELRELLRPVEVEQELN